MGPERLEAVLLMAVTACVATSLGIIVGFLMTALVR